MPLAAEGRLRDGVRREGFGGLGITGTGTGIRSICCRTWHHSGRAPASASTTADTTRGFRITAVAVQAQGRFGRHYYLRCWCIACGREIRWVLLPGLFLIEIKQSLKLFSKPMGLCIQMHVFPRSQLSPFIW
jgi:hypothetical protein